MGWPCALLLFVGVAATAAGRPEAGLERARRALAGGAYEQAIRLGEQARPAAEGQLIAAAGELRLGRHAAAERRLRAILRAAPTPARLLLGGLYEGSGRTAAARANWNRLGDDYARGRVDRRSAPALTAVAVAARHLGSHEDANRLLRDAVAVDGAYLPARLEWARTFLERHATDEAAGDVRAALALAPDDADARALFGRLLREQGETGRAAEQAARALAVNPRHAEALALLGEVALEEGDLVAARRAGAAILATNPAAIAGRALRAAAALLSDDAPGYVAERQAALALHPRGSGFFLPVAEALVKRQRYAEANRIEEEGLALDPDDAAALSASGQNLLRLGREAAGLARLRAAFARDRYDLRTYNLITLFEEILPARYVDLAVADVDGEGTPLRLRVAASEREVVSRTVVPLLRTAFRELAARYHCRLDPPPQIELYADPAHYAVRATGLPQQETLGATFGHLLVARSPLAGRFNWAMMLWHEIDHVFALQLSRGRAPRWFGEGLAEYETARHDPSFRRHTQAALHAALHAGQLPGIGELDRAFNRARFGGEMALAYHHAAEVVGFLVRRLGEGRVIALLRRFGDGVAVATVLEEATGIDGAALDAAFRADLAARLSGYDRQFVLAPSPIADEAAGAAAVTAAADDPRALVRRGLEQLSPGRDLAGAARAIERVLVLAPSSLEARFADAELRRAQGDPAAAVGAAERLIAGGGDGAAARLLLGDGLATLSRSAAAAREYERAAALDPESALPLRALARLYEGSDDAAAAVALERAARIEVHDLALARRLARLLSAGARWREARAVTARAALIAPADPELRRIAAQAALQLGEPAAARAELELALAAATTQPPLQVAPLKGLLARALALSGDRAGGRALAIEVLRLLPDNPDARAALAP